MMFITGPLYSGKRTFARNFRGSVIADVQDAAAETQTPEQLETLARELAEYDIVIATEVAAVLSRWMLRSAPGGGRRTTGLPAGRARRLRGADVLRHPDGIERRITPMLIYLLRHGLTEYNAQKRYQASATSRSRRRA